MENYYGQNQNFDSEHDPEHDTDYNNSSNHGENFPQNQNLGKKQKAMVGLLVLFAFFIILMWSSNLKQSISGPFAYPDDISSDNLAAQGCVSGDCLMEENLKLKDTDGDGLSDWDELYVYGTSPYLTDTSGDGISDMEAIMMGIDPNCPKGRDCSYFSPTENVAGDLSTADSFNFLLDDSLPGQGGEISEQDILQMLGGEGGVGIRELFLMSGEFDEEFLSQYTDEELAEAYQAVEQE